jgi:nucleolar protein 12
VAFKAPTNPQALKEDGPVSKPGRQQDRAFSWRVGKEDADGEGSKPKAYLSPAEKKRVAFIKGEFHDQAASVNAYAVFAHNDPNQTRPSTQIDAMKPSEIAAVVAEQMDGTPFEGRTLRVDRVALPSQSKGDTVVRDPASTVFVGNLEFTAHEEDLRTFFETLLASEMGPPSHSQNPTDEVLDQPRTAHWVSSVRIIRDKDTQLGKGFGYVRFVVRLVAHSWHFLQPFI